MKTSNMITILRCPGDSISLCNKCPSLDDCKGFAGQNLCEVAADRLEQLIINLRTTQEQLQTIKGERDAWRKRYMRLQSSLKNVVHENELLDNLMS